MLAVMLFLGFFTGDPESLPVTPEGNLFSLILPVAGMLFLLTASFVTDRLVRWRLARPGLSPLFRREIVGFTENAVRTLLALVFILVLAYSAFPWNLAILAGLAPAGSGVIELIGIAGFIPHFLAAWLPLYRLHRLTYPGSWTFPSFLVHKARYNLYLLVIWLPFTFIFDWANGFLPAIPVFFFAMVWFFPRVLAKVWGCRPLEDASVIASVQRLEKIAGVRFSRVFLWEPGGGGIMNAAVVGLFHPFRYLFLTPRLLSGLNPAEIDSVILHELGHVRWKHLLFYLFTTFASLNLAVIIVSELPLHSGMETYAVLAILILAYFRFVFGYFSRTLERQADAFALQRTGSAAALISALEKIALAAGNIRRLRSWHHLGIAERVEFLRHAQTYPQIAIHHDNQACVMMGFGFLLSLCMIVKLGFLAYQELTPYEPETPTLAREAAPRHWRRVMTLIPEAAIGPLELAYSLAANPAHQEEAKRLAAQAIRLSRDAEERRAAEKLIEELSGEGK
jgi:Zn-dependent protease with chaperone function